MGDKFGEEILKRLEEKLENLEKNNILVSKNVEEITETVQYLKDLLYRYLNLSEKTKKTESVLINTLFFAVGFLLGFAIALLIFKG